MDIESLEEKTLKRSPTWMKYVEADGLCTKCGEHTNPLDTCCSAPVHFEGRTVDPDALWDQIEKEIDNWAQPDHDQEGKDRS